MQPNSACMALVLRLQAFYQGVIGDAPRGTRDGTVFRARRRLVLLGLSCLSQHAQAPCKPSHVMLLWDAKQGTRVAP